MLSNAKEPSSDRPESSALIALRELRRLEDDRVRREAEALKARTEAERRAQIEAEQQARREQEQQARDKEERALQLEQEKQARLREDQLRLEETERRARVEGELRLKERQLQMEQERRRQNPRARWSGQSLATLLIGGVALLLLGIGAATMVISSQHEQITHGFEIEIAQQRELARTERARHEDRIRGIQQDMDRRLREAQAAARRASPPAESDRKLQGGKATRQRHLPPRPAIGPTDPAHSPASHPPRGSKPEIDDDPLGGLESEQP